MGKTILGQGILLVKFGVWRALKVESRPSDLPPKVYVLRKERNICRKWGEDYIRGLPRCVSACDSEVELGQSSERLSCAFGLKRGAISAGYFRPRNLKMFSFFWALGAIDHALENAQRLANTTNICSSQNSGSLSEKTFENALWS